MVSAMFECVFSEFCYFDFARPLIMDGVGYVSSTASGKEPRNCCAKFARGIIAKTHPAALPPTLERDIRSLYSGHGVYLPRFIQDPDWGIMMDLAKELQSHAKGDSMICWSKHFKHENPSFSPTFRKLVEHLATYFDLDVKATRLNFYKDNSSWKCFHRDSHAVHDGVREDYTVGLSCGATRALAFKHIDTGVTFELPQNHMDVFAFNSTVNAAFEHGVPRASSSSAESGPRFSIIAWGRRRRLTSRNAGTSELDGAAEREAEYADKAWLAGVPEAGAPGCAKPPTTEQPEGDEGEERERVNADQVMQLVTDFVSKRGAPGAVGGGTKGAARTKGGRGRGRGGRGGRGRNARLTRSTDGASRGRGRGRNGGGGGGGLNRSGSGWGS